MCLSTVDRRSRERFVESNHQIAALVDKFKIEGPALHKGVGPHPMDIMGHNSKIPLLQGRPSKFLVGWNLYVQVPLLKKLLLRNHSAQA